MILWANPPTLIGDGLEYVAMATNLSQSEKPSLNWRDRLEHGLAFPGLTASDGRQDCLHFWMYSAVVALPLRWTLAMGADGAWAFGVVNLLLFIVALGVASRRVHWIGAAVVFASPIIWWINKVHTEVFTFSLLVIAWSLCRTHPIASGVSVGLAAAQNPPILLVAVCISTAQLVSRAIPIKRIVIGTGVTIVIAALHPLYYWVRLGRLTPLAEASSWANASIASFFAVLLDPNIGLVPNHPLLVVAVLLAVAGLRREGDPSVRPYMIAAVVSVGLLLGTFSQVVNLNHGGTPSISRYALWLIPMAVPFFFTIKDSKPFAPVALSITAVGSVVCSSLLYYPSAPERFLEPTPLARYLWLKAPSLNNPVPEIFFERLLHRENVIFVAAATEGCTKILIDHRRYPEHCGVIPLPDICVTGYCYANKRANGIYDFVATKGRRAPNPISR